MRQFQLKSTKVCRELQKTIKRGMFLLEQILKTESQPHSKIFILISKIGATREVLII